jgi:hypothetical protein
MAAFARTVALGFGLVGATAASQLPEFAQQYTQRLGGAVDELKLLVEDFDRDARAYGLERQAALERMVRNVDAFVRDRGQAARETIGRFERLEPIYRTMREGTAAERLWTMTAGGDPQIARRTFDDFRPAMPLTLDGVFAAATGFVLGLTGVLVVSALSRRLRRPKAKTAWTPAEPPPPRSPQARGG